MIRQIYLDMDGVLTDLEGGLRKVNLLEDKEKNYDRDEFWRRMKVFGTDLWANLDPYPWTHDLVEACYDAVGQPNVFILSAPSRTCTPVCSGKMAWLEKHLPEFPFDGRVIFAKQKHLLAQPDRLLIDDKQENCEQFREAGGLTQRFRPDDRNCSSIVISSLRRVGRHGSPPAVVQSSRGLQYPADQGPSSD